MNLAGRDVTDYLIKILREDNTIFPTNAEKNFAKDIKEEICYVALDFEKEKSNYQKMKYKMHDDNFGDKKFKEPEILFHPKNVC